MQLKWRRGGKASAGVAPENQPLASQPLLTASEACRPSYFNTVVWPVSGPGSGRIYGKETAALPAPGGGGRAVVGAQFDVVCGGRSPALVGATSGRRKRPAAGREGDAARDP